jgi:hypothetical protein
MERKCSAYTALEGVATEVFTEKSLPTGARGFLRNIYRQQHRLDRLRIIA